MTTKFIFRGRGRVKNVEHRSRELEKNYVEVNIMTLGRESNRRLETTGQW
jgi:hypothetical protein